MSREPDLMATFAKIVLGAWIAACVAAAFLWLPPALGFQEPRLAPIVALHLPNAMVTVVAAFMAGAYGLKYLIRGRNPLDDARSKNATALAAFFCILTTATGSLFARVQWGSYWNWDPREISIFLLLLVYSAYFVLRAGVEDPDRKASLSGVYIVFAAVMTPLLGYVIPKYLPSLHPKDTVFDPRYHVVIWSMTAGMIGLYSWMLHLAVRYDRACLALADVLDGEA